MARIKIKESSESDLHCPFCHTYIDGAEDRYLCGDCSTNYHTLCSEELDVCGTLGCNNVFRTRSTKASKSKKSLSIPILYLLCLLCLLISVIFGIGLLAIKVRVLVFLFIPLLFMVVILSGDLYH